jgi:hypothetical protein
MQLTPTLLLLQPMHQHFGYHQAAKLSAARHLWEEDVQTYRTCTYVQQALKKQIIGVFEPMYLEILNGNMVGYANISARDMLDHLFETYGNITSVDLEINFEHMPQAMDPQQTVEFLFKQIQDSADYSEAGGVPISPSQHINVGYAKIFATGKFTSACRRWNEKPAVEKTWTHFKSHVAASHRHNEQMKGETADVKLPQPQLRTRIYTQTGQSTLRATQVRAALSHAYAVTCQNRITDKP